MNELDRCPDEWYRGEKGFMVPWIVWKLKLRLPNREGNLDLLRHFLTRFETFRAPADDKDLVAAALNIVALRLQAGDSRYLLEWLSQHFELLALPGFRYPYMDEIVGLEAGRQAIGIVAGLLGDRHTDADVFMADAGRRLAESKSLVKAIAPNGEVARWLIEASIRGIPVRRISASMVLYRLGLGCHQKKIWRGFTPYTSHIGTVAATHKHIASELLRSVGLPVARHRQAIDAATAVQAAIEIGYPLVVKPTSTDYGTAVSKDIRNEAELVTAVRSALDHGTVLVEEQIPGVDHRLVVVDGKFVSTIRRIPAHIVGDGVANVADLVARMQVARREDPNLELYKAAALDDPLVQETLRRQRLTVESIPTLGQIVMLRMNSNVSTGGTFLDVTAHTHPENARLAERAAACLGLDHAGIDFITPDISRPWHEIECGICEINPTPGMDLPAMQRLLDYLFPSGSDGTIPVVVVIGNAFDAEPLVAAVQRRALETGRVSGAVWDGFAWIDKEKACRDVRPVIALLDTVISDPAVGVVVVQVSADELLRNGLRLPRCDLAVFLTDHDTYKAVVASPRSTVGRACGVLLNPMPDELDKALLTL